MSKPSSKHRTHGLDWKKSIKSIFSDDLTLFSRRSNSSNSWDKHDHEELVAPTNDSQLFIRKYNLYLQSAYFK